MTNYGFYIKRLRVEKTQKKYSEVSFKRGLNVISGASDTGKTYVYQCIDYLLGAKDEPKDIPEAADHKTFYLECELYSGGIFTIERTLGSKTVTVIPGLIESSFEPTVDGRKILGVAKTQSQSANESLPNFLLEMSGFSVNAFMKKNVRNEKKELSFRNISPLVMVDEEKVISSTSPFVSPQVVNRTIDKSLIKFVVSGEDDSELEEIEDPEIRKNTLKAQLSYIESLLKKLNVKISDLKDEEGGLPNNTKGVEYIFGDFSELENQIGALTTKRAEVIRQKDSLELSIAAKRQLLERFLLLKEHYETDIQRLEFITDGATKLSSIKTNNCECVLCGSDMSKETGKYINSDFSEALLSEKEKTNISLKGLTLSIKDVELSVEDMTKMRHEYSVISSELTQKIDKELVPLKEEISLKLNTLVKHEQKQSKLKELRKQLDERTGERDSIQIDLLSVDASASSGYIPDKEMKSLSGFVQDILKRWQFVDDEKVSIELSDYDTEINGKKRGLFGKGKRALITTANLIALMNYCIKSELPHPGFVIVDTPLTPYKDTDPSSEDKLTDKVQNAFFEDLAELSGDLQVIVIENKVPPDSIKTSINHIHFSGNNKVGRKGFIIA